MAITNPVDRRIVNDTFFIHGTFGSFFSGVLDFFGDDFYPRFNYKVISTFDKAVQFFIDKKKQGIDPNGKILPSISLDPMLDFSPADVGGRQLWQYQNMAPGLGMRMYPKGIDLKEQDIKINVVFTRYQGTFETTFWLSSIYELLDFRTMLLQYTGGFGRWIRPKYFWTSLILPEAVENYELENGSKIDWSNTDVDVIHVNTINQHKLAIPIPLDPMWKLDSFADASTKYGGDQIAEYKLSASFTYEVNIPTYVVTSRGLDPKILLSFSLGSTNTKYPLSSPYKILKAMAEIDPTLVDKSVSAEFSMYKISDPILESSSLSLTFSENVLRYPDKLVDWNTIVSGTLIYVTPQWLLDPKNVVTKKNIILIDTYSDSMIHSIRRCAGVICKSDTKTGVLYSKCDLLKKPLITYISTDEYNHVKSLVNSNITLDILNRKLYSGLLETELADITDPQVGYDIIQSIKNKDPELYKNTAESLRKSNPFDNLESTKLGSVDIAQMLKRMVSDNCSGLQKTFFLGYILEPSSIPGLLIYVNDILSIQGSDYTIIGSDTIEFTVAPDSGSTIYIGGSFLTIKDSQLVATYEFTELDLTSTDPRIISLPVKVAMNDDIVLISYIGRLEQGVDYNLDLDNSKVILLLKPKVGQTVQVFLYL